MRYNNCPQCGVKLILYIDYNKLYVKNAYDRDMICPNIFIYNDVNKSHTIISKYYESYFYEDYSVVCDNTLHSYILFDQKTLCPYKLSKEVFIRISSSTKEKALFLIKEYLLFL